MTIPNPFVFWSDISAPVVTDPQGAIKLALNADAVKVSIDNILRTRPTERVMLPSFGAGLSGFLFDPIDEQMFNTFTNEIRDSITKWDNRVIVGSADYRTKADQNFVEVTIRFMIRGYDEVFEHTTLV